MAAARNRLPLALALIEESLGALKTPVNLLQLKAMKLQILMQTEPNAESLLSTADEVLKEAKQIQPAMVNDAAWGLYEAMAEGKPNHRLINKLIPAIQDLANQMTGDDKAVTLDTLSHLHALGGDKAQAIRIQQVAVSTATNASTAKQLQEYLNELKK
jgi:hypothetical protein